MHNGTVGDWGQSVFQLGGDDRFENCIVTDIAFSACYSRILKLLAPFFVELQPILIKDWSRNESRRLP